MVYDPKAENLAHLRRIGADLLEFDGRSQRTEFVVYLVAMAALSIAILVIAVLMSGTYGVPYGAYVQDALWLTAIPLFVRRLHDQNRSGWFALILPAILALKVYGRAQFDIGHFAIPDVGFPYNIIGVGLVVAFWVLVFWPGTDGENRFGLDPRKDLPA